MFCFWAPRRACSRPDVRLHHSHHNPTVQAQPLTARSTVTSITSTGRSEPQPLQVSSASK